MGNSDTRHRAAWPIDYNVSMKRTVAVPTAVTVGAAVVLVGTFLPWWRSGTRGRSSYQLFELLERLGFAPDGPAATAVRWWPVVPLLLVVAVLAAWWERWAMAALVATAAAVYAFSFALAIRTAPGTALIGTGVTIAGSIVLLVAAVSSAWRAVT